MRLTDSIERTPAVNSSKKSSYPASPLDSTDELRLQTSSPAQSKCLEEDCHINKGGITDRKAFIGQRRNPGEPHICNTISILSWNVLADSLLTNHVHAYRHIQPEWKLWPLRCAAIIRELISTSADVICLQEVEFKAFETDFLQALKVVGYDGVIQSNEKKSKKHCQGVAIFWKREKFIEVSKFSRSRSLVVILRDNASRNIAVCNVHLEGHPMKSVARVKQLQSTLKQLKHRHSHHALIIAGDFNCQFRSSACGAYLSFGSCPPGVLEWGRPVHEVSKIPPHDYCLSATNFPSTPTHTDSHLYTSDEFDFTYCQHAGKPVAGLDQIWFSHNVLTLVGRRTLFKSDEQRLQILKCGAPNPANYSDHIPVGAVFEWKPCNGSLLELNAPPQNIHNSAPRKTQQPNQCSNHDKKKISEEADSLLAACPLTKEQRIEFEEISVTLPGLPLKGKPTPEQIILLKERRLRKTELLEGVSPESRQMLQRVMKLRKLIRT